MNGQRVNIYVDGWCEKNPGRGGWRVMAGGETVSERVMEKTTNNLCEYFAVIDAIRWVKKQPHNKLWTIWTDSTTAIAWLRNNKVKTSLTDDKTVDIIKKCQDFVASIDNDNFIVKKWHTKRLGEIPADFGRKKKTKRPRSIKSKIQIPKSDRPQNQRPHLVELRKLGSRTIQRFYFKTEIEAKDFMKKNSNKSKVAEYLKLDLTIF